MPQYSNIETPAINMVTIKIIMDNFNLVEDFNIKTETATGLLQNYQTG